MVCLPYFLIWVTVTFVLRFGLSWLLEPLYLANTALAPTPEHISSLTPGYVRSSGVRLLCRLDASRKG